MNVVEITLVTNSKSDVALRKLAAQDHPFRMTNNDGNLIVYGRGIVRRRAVGRKLGLRVRYWIEVAP